MAANAVPVVFTYTDTISNSNNPLIAEGDTLTIVLIMDNGGHSLSSQNWSSPDLISGLFTAGLYFQLFTDSLCGRFSTDAAGTATSAICGTAGWNTDSFGSGEPVYLFNNAIRDFNGNLTHFNRDAMSLFPGNWTVAFATVTEPSTFNDVPAEYWAYSFIEALVRNGITAGCGNGNYCPNDPVTRAQMAVFLERGIYGGDFSPQSASGTLFNDVSAGDFAAAFIEQLFADGITSGCGNGNYCPNDHVTRAQMAIFLLRAKYGPGYVPPPWPVPCFGDLGNSSFSPDWICQLAAEGISAGCGGGNYCPGDDVTRDQMAVFLVRTFGLQ